RLFYDSCELLRHVVPGRASELLSKRDDGRRVPPGLGSPAPQALGQVRRVLGVGDQQVVELGRVALRDPGRLGDQGGDPAAEGLLGDERVWLVPGGYDVRVASPEQVGNVATKSDEVDAGRQAGRGGTLLPGGQP